MIGQTGDIDSCRAIRRAVFVIEQNVPEAEEWDDLDADAIHLLARDSLGRGIGTARLLIPDGVGKITRVAVMPEARGKGIGAALIVHALKILRNHPGVTTARLGAQNHAIPFYEKLGFSVIAGEYMDAGIPHHDMVLTL